MRVLLRQVCCDIPVRLSFVGACAEVGVFFAVRVEQIWQSRHVLVEGPNGNGHFSSFASASRTYAAKQPTWFIQHVS